MVLPPLNYIIKALNYIKNEGSTRLLSTHNQVVLNIFEQKVINCCFTGVYYFICCTTLYKPLNKLDSVHEQQTWTGARNEWNA